ncbi:imidazole glycerol phosphate synthase subunit HisH [Thalassobacillus hwangdonensis]|uniref:Imidazole glycerol phosphate synthase subunit HisH n=1 Tax=Thalassobacillus hwangdonensis TaxID=546108 RepID=A0ABW3L596_9BACI
MIGIIDYGMGNLFSVSKALERLDVPYVIGDRPEKLEGCDGYILPGVGAFPDAMKALDQHGFTDFVKTLVDESIPLYGICLGMQLLFEKSEENGSNKGLGLLPGSVIRFVGHDKEGKKYKVPHMGWNKLEVYQPYNQLMRGIEEDYVYFVHSFYVDTTDRSILLASSTYDVEVPAIVGKGSLYASQFHPEKSGEAGMKLLRNFCDQVEQSKGGRR